ncbi:MAG: transcriptional repressor [Bdellovibrionaceae bacterium]|nr:transcriptional repressor [Pseudobdellovibrionaceae bacterium]MDW8190160.1 transcriptional repressor [Pseudobdellovibrionaceae bacterium]
MEKDHLKLPRQGDFQETLLRKRDSLSLDDLKNLLRNLNLKITDQRLLILKTLNDGTRTHMTAQEIYEKVRRIDSSIGFATVYRLLKRLAQSGVVTEVRVGSAPSRYELTAKYHHDHLTCVMCGLIIEFECDEIERLQQQIAQRFGFLLKDHVLELYGICSKCAALSNSKKSD